MLMSPLASLPSWLAAGLWTAASVAALAAVVALVRRALDRPAPGWLVALLALGAVALEPIWQNLVFGQVNTLIMLAVLVDLLGPSHRWSGVLLGIAAGVKLTPLVFVVLLVLVGRRTAAGRAILAFVGTVVVGFVANRGGRRAGAMAWSTGRRTSRLAHNQSVYGALTRLLDAQAFDPVARGRRAGRRRRARRRRPLVAAWRPGPGPCLAAVSMLLASPISWSHHWVWSAPIALVLWERGRWAAVAWTVVFVARHHLARLRRGQRVRVDADRPRCRERLPPGRDCLRGVGGTRRFHQRMGTWVSGSGRQKQALEIFPAGTRVD